MNTSYLLGVAAAVGAGLCNAAGAILQKSEVNALPAEGQERGLMANLLRRPRWWLGLFCTLGIGSVLNLTAQGLVGPALVPGLTSSGMIFLALGSVWLIGERLRAAEWLGIGGMVAGVTLLGLSQLDIPASEVELFAGGLLARMVLFAALLALAWAASYVLSARFRGVARGLALAVSGGFPFALVNLWTLPMMLMAGAAFGGAAQVREWVAFAVITTVLTLANMAGIRQVQQAYRFAPASRVQPIQLLSTQTAPIIVYFWVYGRPAPATASPWLLPLGALCIILSGFLLAGRQAEWKGAD